MSRIAPIILVFALCGVAIAAPQDCTFRASCDGTEQRYMVIEANGGEGARRPTDVLIALHGHGSDRTQFATQTRGECQSVRDIAAERGMLFVSPDYRAKTSWMGPAAESDMLDLIALLKRQRNIRRVFLCGGSMGGTSALTFAARHPELIAGVTAFNPLADHLSYTNFQPAIAASFGGDKKTIPAEYRARSALYFPDRFTMPVSITLGGEDTTVPPASARALAQEIQKRRPDLLYLDEKPKRGHETNYNDSMRALREMFRRADIQASVAVRVTFGDRHVLPSSGSVTGLWFYECGDAQLLLMGFPAQRGWRVSAVGGDWRLNGVPLKSWTDRSGVFIPDCALAPERAPYDPRPVKGSAPLNKTIENALIDWDWRMQDGIGTPREPRTFAQAVVPLRERFRKAGLANPPKQTGDGREWHALHTALRAYALTKVAGRPIFFAKFVPGAMSHQLTQCLGYCSRPGGGLFVLDKPEQGMRPRDVTPPNLPAGSFLNPELSPDATKILFSYAPVTEAPEGSYAGGPALPRFCTPERLKIHYNIYEAPLAGGPARRLTSDGYDDLFPIYLDGGDIVFSSTRRGGYHRCGLGPCPVFTLSRMGPNGENPHSISFHETHEWTPCLLPDGRLMYSRWDYVDRNGVLYQHLWTARPDGGGVRIYYGNNTWNPCGTWEPRPVPDSTKVMAIAGPHHAMSAGSVVLIDTLKGIDGTEPTLRITPEARFPESEDYLAQPPVQLKDLAFDSVPSGYWVGGLIDPKRNTVSTAAERRWPGHCFKSPWPLSETLFLASYSYDRLFGEAGGNIPNQFGLYICDTDGMRELIYRDPRISSLWARPIATRKLPPLVHSAIDPALEKRGVGTFALDKVTESWPNPFPPEYPITALRIFHVLNKTTPNIDTPKVGRGLGSIGREVLGTVPVEADGSAYFEVPAKTPIYFQAIDAKGRAVQTMRSLVYMQPGERESCTGCHEDRRKSYAPARFSQAMKRPPSQIKPEVSGSKPFNFLKLVQPVLDRKCVSCHDGTKPGCPSLKGDPEHWACKSFNALVKHVRYSSWQQQPRNNDEPLTVPLTFGALASPLLKRLESGHGGVKLDDDEMHRLILWMDSNGACWGTFDKEKQRDL